MTLSSHTLPTTQQTFIQPLFMDHLSQMLFLQDTVLQNLAPEKRNYIVPKSESDLAKFISGPYHAIGVFCDNQLVAQTLVAVVQPNDDNKNLTLCDAVEPIVTQPSCYGVIEGVLVHPDYRLHGFMNNMVSSSLELLQKEYQCSRIYSEIAVDNEASIRGFLKNSFECIGQGVDPSDGCNLVFMQHMNP